MHTKGVLRRVWLNDGDKSDVCVTSRSGNVLLHIKFQEGPVRIVGVNGICMLDVIDAMKDRLRQFERKWPCRENKAALECFTGAAQALIEKRERRRREL